MMKKTYKFFILILIFTYCGNPKKEQNVNENLTDKVKDEAILGLLDTTNRVQDNDVNKNQKNGFGHPFDSLPFERCNIKVVLATERSMDDMDLSKVNKFLYSFCDSCRSNIEYSQYSNRVLFELLENHAELVLNSLKENDELDVDKILQEISMPVSDATDLRKLKMIIQKIEDKNDIKEGVLNSISVAINRLN
jgi:hypothetical protein